MDASIRKSTFLFIKDTKSSFVQDLRPLGSNQVYKEYIVSQYIYGREGI